jgi:tRNA U34 5-carboxymethylaminomethyl modifying enzyme MnmG/GidA
MHTMNSKKTFDGCEVNHVSRFNNDKADVLVTVFSHTTRNSLGRNQRELNQAEETCSAEATKKKDKFKKVSGAAAALETSTSDEDDEPEEVMMIQVPWMQAYLAYITKKKYQKTQWRRAKLLGDPKHLQWSKGSCINVAYRASCRDVLHPKKDN